MKCELQLRVLSRLLLVLLALLALPVAYVECDRPSFPIAVLCTFPNPQHSTVYDIPCQDRLDAYRLYAQHINQQGNILVNGIPYTLNITYFDVGFGTDPNDMTLVSAVGKKIIIDNAYGYFPVIIAPYSSIYTLVVAGFGEAAKRVVYASAAITDLIFECPSPPNPTLGADCISTGKRPGDRRYQYTFATNPTALNRWNGLIYTVKVTGAQTVAIIDSSDLASQYNGAGAASAAEANNLNIVEHHILTGNDTLADRGLVGPWLSQLRQNWPNLDVLIINNYAELAAGCGTLLQLSHDMNWLPKTFACAFGPSTVDLIDLVGDMQSYTTAGTAYDPRLKAAVDPAIYRNDPWVSSIDALTNTIRQDAPLNAYISQSAWRAPTPWTIQYNTAMYDMTILQRALAMTRLNYTQVTNTSDPQQMAQAALFTDALRQATQGLYEPTWFGKLQFDQDGRLATEMIIGQTKDGTPLTYDIIYPLSSQTAPFVYPMPTWDERVYRPGYGKRESEKLVLGFNTAVIAVSLGLAVFVIVYRNTKTVKASSPMFLLCMLLGCILMSSSIYTWTMYETKSSCFAHVWLFSVGYILMFAPLFAKTWRLYRIFSSSNLIVEVLTDGKIFGYVCAPLLLFELIYLAIWSGVAPFEARTTVVDPIRPAYNYDSCYYSNASQGFFLASLAYKIAFLVAGCIFIFIARNIPSSFNETPVIGAAIYNVLFSSAILVPIVATDALPREPCFLVRSFGIMIATLLSELMIVCPKIYHLITYGDVQLSFRMHDKPVISQSTTTHSSTSLQRQKSNMELTTTHPAGGGIGSSSLQGRTLTAMAPGSDSLVVRTLGSGPGPLPPSFTAALYESLPSSQLQGMIMETQHKLTLLQLSLQNKQSTGTGTGAGTTTGTGAVAALQGRLSLTASPVHAQTPRPMCRMDSWSSLPPSFPVIRPDPQLGDRGSSDVSTLHISP